MSQIPPANPMPPKQVQIAQKQRAGSATTDRLGPGVIPSLPKGQDFLRSCSIPPQWLQGDQRRRAEQLTSYFENSSLELQYDYIENIGDGRGYTAGRAGFTTRTGDFLMVVEDYSKLKPVNPLHLHLPRLRRLAESDSSSTSGLPGIVGHWKKACKDSGFREVQDAVVNRLYFEPAMRKADELGLQLPLSRAVIYDTIIQHGDGQDADGMPALCALTNSQSQGSPAQGCDEKAWLDRFLANRREDLLHPSDPDTQQAWSESVSRVDALAQIARNGNYALDGPIHVNLPEQDLVFDVP